MAISDDPMDFSKNLSNHRVPTVRFSLGSQILINNHMELISSLMDLTQPVVGPIISLERKAGLKDPWTVFIIDLGQMSNSCSLSSQGGLLFTFQLVKVEKILKGILDSIPSPSVKIQIMGRKVFLRRKGKTLLGIVNKHLNTKSLLTHHPITSCTIHLRRLHSLGG